MDLAAQLMLEAICTFASLQPKYIRTVRIVLYNESARARWRTVMNSM